MYIEYDIGLLEVEMNQNYTEHRGLISQQIKELVGVYRDAIKHLAISESEFWIWYTLVAMPGEHTQQDICALWSLPKQTVNTVITGMRIKKLAYLEIIPGTRNHKIVRLTEEGRRRGEEIVGPVTCAEQKAFAKMPAEELAVLTQVFDKYINVLRGELHEA